MAVIYLGFGSNIGDREAYLRSAVTSLSPRVTLINLSNFYETKPVGYVDQGDFLNAVMQGETRLSPFELLLECHSVEIELGRKRTIRNGPRTLDIDILFYNSLVVSTPELEIPHPRLQEREFVLLPFLELNPSLVHPVLCKTIAQLYSELNR